MAQKNNQILGIVIILALITSVVAIRNTLSMPQAASTDTTPPTILVTGADGLSKNFTISDLEAMPSVSMYGGFYQTKQGTVNNGLWTGVSLLYLCNQVGGIAVGNIVEVIGQGVNNFTYDMICNGTDFNSSYETYNNITGTSQNQTQPINVILAYQVNGTDLPSSSQPAPRLVIVGPEGLLCDGSGGRSITEVIIVNAVPVATPSATASTSITSPSPTIVPSPTVTPETNKEPDQTIYLIAAAIAVAFVVVAMAVFVLRRKKTA